MTIERLDQDGNSTVLVSIGNVSVCLGPEELDVMIQHLSYIRASMKPAIPEMPPRTQQYVMEMDPCWYAEKNPLYDGAMLFLRHTGLGWTSFAIPSHSLEKLQESLACCLEGEQQTYNLPN